MGGAWLIARRPGRSGWIDAIWSFAVGVASVAAALAPVGHAPDLRQRLVAGMVALWSLRLGGHIALRSAHGGDDPRYVALREAWGGSFSVRLLGFLQIQAAAGWLLAICVMMAARAPAPAYRLGDLAWSDYAGAGLLIAAVIGEGLADAQLKAFRAHPANARLVCDTGLWGLSRHPNYLFEWLGWVAYAVIAMGPSAGALPGWIAWSGPVFMYWLLVHVSGIPPLEAHMLRSRGEAFRAVQRRVPAFWPIPRASKELP